MIKAVNSNGIDVADYDLDGHLDVYIVGAERYSAQYEATWNRLFSNNGDGKIVTQSPGMVRIAMASH